MNKEKGNLAQQIVEAGKAGTFLEFVYKASRNQQHEDQIVELLISVHNTGELDIVNEFKNLENKPHSGRDFFLTRHLFEKVLPRLNAPVQPVMECAQHLVKEAGNDMTAGIIIQPFIAFCETEPSRANEALDIVVGSPEQWRDLLSPILVAGASDDMKQFFQKAVDLSSHDDAGIRRNAIHALGQFHFPTGAVLVDRAKDCLTEVIDKEEDDQVLSQLVSTTCSLCFSDNSQTDSGAEIIKSALAKGNEFTLHATSTVFAYEMKKLPEKILDVFLPFLVNIDTKHAGTLSNLGYGVAGLLKRHDPTKGIEFLEILLTNHHGELSIKSLGSLVHSIHKLGYALLNRLLTRWFLNGDPVLCTSITSILDTIHGDNLQLEIDPAEIPSDDPALYLFIARKSIGFLFMKPTTCTSIILSLMKKTQNKELIHDLGRLLFDPILLNFSGSPYDFLKKRTDSLDGMVRDAVQTAIDAINEYLETLRSIPDIPEMYPSQEQREARIRRHNREMAESYRNAQKGSIVDLICSKSILLYGNASIMHVQDASGKSRRMEIPMQHHSMTFEVPRQADIDPLGVDFMLRVYRNERFVNQ